MCLCVLLGVLHYWAWCGLLEVTCASAGASVAGWNEVPAHKKKPPAFSQCLDIICTVVCRPGFSPAEETFLNKHDTVAQAPNQL